MCNILNISKIGGGNSLNYSCSDIYNPLLLANVSSKGFLFSERVLFNLTHTLL